MASYLKRSISCWVNDMKNVVEAAKEKRAKMDAEKKEHDSVKAENADLKGKKDKQDKLAKVVKALTKAEYDALPKELQKELKDFR